MLHFSWTFRISTKIGNFPHWTGPLRRTSGLSTKMVDNFLDFLGIPIVWDNFQLSKYKKFLQMLLEIYRLDLISLELRPFTVFRKASFISCNIGVRDVIFQQSCWCFHETPARMTSLDTLCKMQHPYSSLSGVIGKSLIRFPVAW